MANTKRMLKIPLRAIADAGFGPFSQAEVRSRSSFEEPQDEEHKKYEYVVTKAHLEEQRRANMLGRHKPGVSKVGRNYWIALVLIVVVL